MKSPSPLSTFPPPPPGEIMVAELCSKADGASPLESRLLLRSSVSPFMCNLMLAARLQ